MAHTNHALDHILRSVHENNVTKSMIRMGSGTKDEVIERYLLKTLEKERTTGNPLRVPLKKLETVSRSSTRRVVTLISRG